MDNISTSICFAANDAYSMLQFASSRGVDVDQQTVDNIIVAVSNSNNLTVSQEVNFWLSYSKLSKLIGPVTLEGIQAKTDSIIKTRILGKDICIPLPSAAKRSVFMYTILTFFSLALFLSIGVYSFLGSDSLNELEKLNDLIKAENTKTPSSEKTVNLENLKSKRNSIYIFLSHWNDFPETVLVYFNIIKSQKFNPTELQNPEQIHKAAAGESLQETVVEKTIRAINLYFVPMICGILGVCSYILRSLSSEIKDSTFTRESRIRFRLRIPLGCLAGAVAGFIFDTGTGRVASVLPPMGLAFAFGYSVEVFFSLLDSLLSTMVKK